jgi:hypothetical protein
LQRLLPLVFGLAFSLLWPAARASSPEDVARREYAITGFRPPARWELLPRDRPSYPQLLGYTSRGQGAERAVITLVGKRLAPGTTLQQFAAEATQLAEAPRLTNLRMQPQPASGFTGGQRIQVDAVIAAEGEGQRPRVLRQFLLMNQPFGYVLTLIAPQDQAAARYRDLDDTLGSLAPLPTQGATPRPAPAADAPAAPRR